MIQSWIMLPVFKLSESVVAMQTRSGDSCRMYMWGSLGLWVGQRTVPQMQPLTPHSLRQMRLRKAIASLSAFD
jgi:hypothetical protein